MNRLKRENYLAWLLVQLLLWPLRVLRRVAWWTFFVLVFGVIWFTVGIALMGVGAGL